jgi:glycosyltransferase TcdB-like subunit of Tc toxinin
LRGSILRTELYALDGTNQQNRPYTVTEHLQGVREEWPPGKDDQDRLRIFFFILSPSARPSGSGATSR